MADDPKPAFSPVETEIAMLAGKGYGHFRIAACLRRSPGGIRQTVNTMALKLPNPDELPPLTLIQLWGAHRIWLTLQPQKNPSNAA
jgi:hypothetical protein